MLQRCPARWRGLPVSLRAAWRPLDFCRGMRRSAACKASNLDPPDVRKLAQLAHIHVTDQEVEEWQPKLQAIVGWLDKLQEIDVDNVDPTSRLSFEAPSAAGKDVPQEFGNREALLDAVPKREGSYVRVPKIM